LMSVPADRWVEAYRQSLQKRESIMNNSTGESIGWDPKWEQIFSSRPWGKYPPEPIIREVMRAFSKNADRKQVRMLDLGCGPGANTWFMAREGFSVSGIDGSASAIAQNRQRLANERLSADLSVGDFTVALPWPDQTFDGVIDNVA